MLYILECMIRMLGSWHSGFSDKAMWTTGHAITHHDISVGALSWLITILLILFIRYCIVYAIRRNKEKLDDSCGNDLQNEYCGKKGFWQGIVYLLECFALPFICLYVRKRVSLRTTGKKIASKEITVCIISWIVIIIMIIEIVLICVL